MLGYGLGINDGCGFEVRCQVFQSSDQGLMMAVPVVILNWDHDFSTVWYPDGSFLCPEIAIHKLP